MKELVTYLTFDGNCREAMTFYAEALGGALQLMTPGDMGNHGPEADRIMHSNIKWGGPQGGRATLMASDTMNATPFTLYRGNNFAISIDCDSAEEEDRYFKALGVGGKVTMELQDTFWGARFGMLTDKFGIAWMFNFEKPKA